MILENRAFLVFLLLVSLSFAWLLSPFFAPIFWAIAVCIIFYPIKLKLTKRLPGRDNTVAFLTLLSAMLIVILPITFLLVNAIGEAQTLYASIRSGNFDLAQKLQEIVDSSEFIKDSLIRFNLSPDNIQERITARVGENSRMIVDSTLNIGQNMTAFVLNLGIMLYVAFFIIRDGERLKELMIEALPLGDERERLLFKRFSDVVNAALKGNLVVAAVQGAIGGIAFWALGIPSAMLWTFAMMFASLIPAVGAALIWAPVAIYFAATGQYTEAIILTVVGVVVIGLMDNLLRPILVGRDTKLPDYIILTSTLGGIALFGIGGFVVGPIIAALFVSSWNIFMREFVDPDQPAEERLHEDSVKTDSAAVNSD